MHWYRFKSLPENQRILFRLIPTLLEPEEQVFRLGYIEISRYLVYVWVADLRFDHA